MESGTRVVKFLTRALNIYYSDDHFCIEVTFPNSAKDVLILTKVPGTSIFEGVLQEDDEVSVVMIDTPATKKRMVIINMVV